MNARLLIMNTLSSVLTVSVLTFVFSAQITVHRPQNQADYFNIIFSHNHTLVAYYNSALHPKHHSHIQSFVKHLSQDPLLNRWGFEVVVADMAFVEMLFNYYEMKSQPNLFYFCRRQLLKMADFSSVFEKSIADGNPAELHDQAITWTHSIIANFTTEILGTAELEESLKQFKVLGMYFGPNDDRFTLFNRWAAKYQTFKFLHSFSADVKEQFLASRGTPVPNSQHLFAVIRHADAVSELDPYPVVLTTATESEESLSAFFNFERYPKLMPEENGSLVSQLMFHHNEKLIVFVTSATTPNSDIESYKRALSYLPKRMIYAIIDVSSRNVAAFMQLFMLGKVAMTPGFVYSVSVSAARYVDVQQMQEKLTADNVVQFVDQFVGRHAEFFKVKRTDSEAPQRERREESPFEEDL